MDLKYILANCLTSDPGDKVMIPCFNDKDAESVRVRLFRLRTLLPVGNHLIRIRKKTLGDTPVIVLERTGPPMDFKIPSGVEKLNMAEGPDYRRIVQAAVEDGKTLSELLDLFPDIISCTMLATMFEEESLKFKQLSEEEDAAAL
jgi:hypothetical protein